MEQKALLDCLTKKIEFVFDDFKYTVDLAEGDLHDSWNTIKSKSGIYDINFSWDESDGSPSFTLYPLKEEEDRHGDKSKVTDCLNPVQTYKVVLVRGNKEDYFGVTFPNGFVSWFETFFQISKVVSYFIDEEDGNQYHQYQIDNGSVAVSHLVRLMTDVFENKFYDEDFLDKDYFGEIDRFVDEYNIN